MSMQLLMARARINHAVGAPSITYAVWDAAKKPPHVTISSPTVAKINTRGNYSIVGATTGKSTGKWIFRMKVNNIDNGIGIGAAVGSNVPWVDDNQWIGAGGIYFGNQVGYQNYYGEWWYGDNTGFISHGGTSTGIAANAWLTVAVDLDSTPQTIKFFAGNTLKVAFSIPADVAGSVWYPCGSMLEVNDTCTLDAGASAAIVIPTPLAGQGYNGYWG